MQCSTVLPLGKLPEAARRPSVLLYFAQIYLKQSLRTTEHGSFAKSYKGHQMKEGGRDGICSTQGNTEMHSKF